MKWIVIQDPEWVDWSRRERKNRFLCKDNGLTFIHYGLDHQLKLCWIWGPDDTIEHLAERLFDRTDYAFTVGVFSRPWLWGYRLGKGEMTEWKTNRICSR